MRRLLAALILVSAMSFILVGCTEGSGDPMEGAPKNTENLPDAPNMGTAPGIMDPKTGASSGPGKVGLPGNKANKGG